MSQQVHYSDINAGKEDTAFKHCEHALELVIQVLVRTQQANLLVPCNTHLCTFVILQSNHSLKWQLFIHFKWAFGSITLLYQNFPQSLKKRCTSRYCTLVRVSKTILTINYFIKCTTPWENIKCNYRTVDNLICLNWMDLWCDVDLTPTVHHI